MHNVIAFSSPLQKLLAKTENKLLQSCGLTVLQNYYPFRVHETKYTYTLPVS